MVYGCYGVSEVLIIVCSLVEGKTFLDMVSCILLFVFNVIVIMVWYWWVKVCGMVYVVDRV